MATLATGFITLTDVSDGIQGEQGPQGVAGVDGKDGADGVSAMLSPTACVIHADYDGSNPRLDNAYTLVTAYLGEEKAPITLSSVTASGSNITYTTQKVDDYTYKVTISSLSSSVLDGYLDISISVNGTIAISTKFLFTVERETTMLDWVLDWEGNKTTIGDSYVITPKLFVGKKITGTYDDIETVTGLTGVYIGPTSDDGCGVYGYNNNAEIFHLDGTGGKIGGWTIGSSSLVSPGGCLTLASSGSIRATDSSGTTLWEILESGYASFAKGSIKMYADGSAEFTGKITSTSGQVGGWSIGESALISTNSLVSISSDGTIKCVDTNNKNNYMWYLGSDGAFSLGKGAIVWNKEIGLDIVGTIHADSGTIGGLKITDGGLSAGGLLIKSGYMSYTDNFGNMVWECDALGFFFSQGNIRFFTNGEAVFDDLAISDGKMYSSGRRMVISSEGYIRYYATDGSTVMWGLNTDGAVSFGGGVVNIGSDGIMEIGNQGVIRMASDTVGEYVWRLEPDVVTFCNNTYEFYANSGYITENMSWDSTGTFKFKSIELTSGFKTSVKVVTSQNYDIGDELFVFVYVNGNVALSLPTVSAEDDGRVICVYNWFSPQITFSPTPPTAVGYGSKGGAYIFANTGVMARLIYCAHVDSWLITYSTDTV